MGRLKVLGISLVAVLALGLLTGASPAAAQTKTVRGTATAVSDVSLTVKVADKSMTFAVDAKTIVMAEGRRKADAQGRRRQGHRLCQDRWRGFGG